jgi:hypothetical protein
MKEGGQPDGWSTLRSLRKLTKADESWIRSGAHPGVGGDLKVRYCQRQVDEIFEKAEQAGKNQEIYKG